jgi:predicted permease
MMSSLGTDLRHAVRRWSDRRGLALTAVLTLALGMGATTAIFSVVDGVLLRPLPWRDADRLVTIWLVRPERRNDPVASGFWNHGVLSWPMVRDLREHSRTLEEVAVGLRPRQVLADGDPAQSVLLSSGFLPMLGVQPYAGRTFIAAEDEAATDSLMISFESWQRRFGGVKDILGRRVTIDNVPRTIVGVLPPRFRFEGEPAEVFLPYGTLPPREREPGNHGYFVVARLKAGVTVAEASADVEPILRGNADPATLTSRVTPLAVEQLGTSSRPLLLLLGASLLLLLIACANVAGLLLGDAGTRRQEIAVRAALGAGRLRVVRQLLAESAVLGVGGGVVGLAIAKMMTPGLVALAPTRLPRIETVAVDLRVFAFALVLCVITIAVFGVSPSWTMSAANPADALREGRGASRRHRAHDGIVVSQVALAVVLLVGASLLGETLVRLISQPVGFDTENLIVLRVRPTRPLASGATFGGLVTSLVERIRSIPGVRSAATTSAAAFAGNFSSNTIEVEGHPGENLSAWRYSVGDGYFETAGVRLLRGRDFASTDASGRNPPTPGDTDATGVTVVSEDLERRYYGGHALGRRLRVNPQTSQRWFTIVGIVADTKLRQYTEPNNPAFYLPGTGEHIVVRTVGDPLALVPALRQTAATADNPMAITLLETMATLMGRTVAGERYRALLSSMFGLAALVLASIGLYGLLARTVADRQREIGVRVALGARPGDVLALIVRDGARLVVAGLAIGIPISLGAAQLIRTQLFGVAPTAPHIIAMACALLATASIVATFVPARRASHVDPIVTLRAN